MQQYLYNLATDKYRGFISSIIKIFLYLLSFIYDLSTRLLVLFSLAKASRLNCKVISIGNITLGGTGKTSLVEYIAKFLKQQGHKVAILSRGYKRKITSYELRVTSYETMGDEPYMLSQNLDDIPVLVDANRLRAAEKAIKDYSADTVILDDGFQQWQIKKDLEIVTIDATNPFGNHYLLPRGILREPLSSLRRADIFILTKTNLNPQIEKLKDFLGSINPKAKIFESIHKPMGFYEVGKKQALLDTQELKAKTITLISGIADPDSFEKLIINLGIDIGLSFRFRDHYHYTREDLEEIMNASNDKGIDTIITTEKDAVRLSQLPVASLHLPVLILRIELQIKDEQGFHSRLLGLYPG